MTPEQRSAHFLFFQRIGQVKTATERRCQFTEPLFPLWLILDADGTLADDARHLVEQTQA